MGFDFNTLITDRTSADVSALSTLLSKKLETWTPEELEQFNSGLLKGGYWWTDLNRVTACMECLDAELSELGYESGYVPIVIERPDIPGESRLPDGYTELEYIESTGTQFIDSGITPNQNTRVVSDFIFRSGGSAFCAYDNGGTRSFGLQYSTGSWFVYYGTASATWVAAIPGNRVLIDINKNVATLNGDDEKAFAQNAFTCPTTLYIFALLTTSASYFSSCVLYSMKIYDNDVLSRDFVPCKNSSGEIGLFDLVSNDFFKNSGSGEFVGGPVVIPDKIPNPFDQYTWYKEDSPTKSQMLRYVENIKAIKDAFDGLNDAPEVPTSAGKLTTTAANNIEKILLAVETAIKQTVKCMVRSNSFAFWSGNRPFPTADSNKGRTWGDLDETNTGWRNWQVATWYLLLYGNLKAEGDVV